MNTKIFGLDYPFNVCTCRNKTSSIIMKIKWQQRCVLLRVTGFPCISENEQYKHSGCYYKHLL